MQKALADSLKETSPPEEEAAATPVAEQDAAAAPTPSESAAHHKHIKTAGEHKFNRLAYTGWGYIGNWVFSLLAIYWIERTKSGQTSLNLMANTLAKTEKGLERAKYYITKSFFLTGGFIIIPPIKWLENKKYEHVHKYNRAIYGDKADNDPVILQSEKEVKEAPKQGWPSIISGRLLALIPYYLTYWLIWDKKSPLSRLTGETVYVDRLIAWGSRWIGWGAAKILGNEKAAGEITQLAKNSKGVVPSIIHRTKDGAVKGTFEPFHSTAPYYFISEAITAAIVAVGLFVITRVTGPFFGRSREQKRELHEERAEEKLDRQAERHHPSQGDAQGGSKSAAALSAHAPETKVSLAGAQHQARAAAQLSAQVS